MRNSLLLVAILFATVACRTQAQIQPIVIDGDFADWQGRSPVYRDASGDQRRGDIDFGRLWLAHDDRFLYLRIEVSRQPVSLLSSNRIAIYLDTDSDASTGEAINGIGAELIWHFGDKRGTFHTRNRVTELRHPDIGLVAAPSVTAAAFEIALDRRARPDGNTPLLAGESIRLQLVDHGAGGDWLPDAGRTVRYSLSGTAPAYRAGNSLRRSAASDLRILSWNVQRDNLFQPALRDHYRRILQALQPDIIAFQEIYGSNAGRVRELVAELLPGNERPWHAAKVNPDIVLASRYRIHGQYDIEGNGAFLLDLRPQADRDLLVINAHTPCCDNDRDRQLEIDAIMAFLREARTRGGPIDLAPQTPFILIGDFNLVGDARQLQTLLNGEIVNTSRHGRAFDPDWDGTSLTDLLPRHTTWPFAFTWYSPESVFSPGRLDFIIYADSVLEPVNQFVLFTPAMPADSLHAYGLHAGDTSRASDHLPLGGDFRLHPQ